jgi:hypothetical protein
VAGLVGDLAFVGSRRRGRGGEPSPEAVARVEIDEMLHTVGWLVQDYDRTETERFHKFSYDELMERDKVSLDIFWL